MGVCEGVPLAAGVPGLEGEALSSWDTTATGISLGAPGEEAADSLGVSSSVQDGSRILRSRSDGTRSVTREGDLPFDLRRSFSLLEADVLVMAGILGTVRVDDAGNASNFGDLTEGWDEVSKTRRG